MHFVGSVALDGPVEVFQAIGQHCGPFLKRVPDGEPGGRRLCVDRFGIASECGISRGRDPQLALNFIKTYADAARA
ncbi:MAG TPA: hypothetical protein VGQ37_05080 [Vicinamibacterales bacterium]|nr:hypothetical protein [Vicinamibacterales bacterium]